MTIPKTWQIERRATSTRDPWWSGKSVINLFNLETISIGKDYTHGASTGCGCMFCDSVRIEEVAALLHGKTEFVAIDLETTGVSTPACRIIEVAAVRFNSSGRVTGEFASLAFPGHGYLHGAEFIHGISQREVEAAPPIAAVLGQLLDFVGGRVVVAHNLPFENRFLGFELKRAQLEQGEILGFCTYSAARRLVSTSVNHKLATLAKHFGIRQASSHRALPDARVGAALAVQLIRAVNTGALAKTSAAVIHLEVPSTPKRLASVRQGFRQGWKPSEEQDAILEAFFEHGDIKILAGAGTGKTTTLQLLANSTKSKITYLTFNKATAVEARDRFASNVSATTIHAFAHAALRAQGKGSWLARLRIGIEPISSTARRFGALEPGFIEAFGSVKLAQQVSPYELTQMAVETVKDYCHSTNQTLLTRHAKIGKPPRNLLPELIPLVLLMAEEHWANIRDEKVIDMPISHDHYLKAWLLTNPILGAEGDILFVDEAQDLSPAVARALKLQHRLKKVYVGDPNQSIYGFAGGKDALASIKTRHTLPLTTSWRFGDGAAAIANGWLRALKSPHLIRANPKRMTTIGPYTQPDAVLTRTNAGAVGELMVLQDLGFSATLRSDAQSITTLLLAAADLMEGRRTRHATLSRFSSWAEVREHVLYDSAGHELRTWTKLIEHYGVPELVHAVNAASVGTGSGPVVSTAHKAKGLEWDTVRIAADFVQVLTIAVFINDKHQLAEEQRLAYVAVTRARKHLDPGPLADSWPPADWTGVTHLPAAQLSGDREVS